MQRLLELGANPNARSAEGATPLMNSVQSNKIAHLNLLISAGADVNAGDDRGFTALHRAAEMGHVQMVKILLKNGADSDVEAGGHTALSLAEMRERNEIVELLRGHR
jgi:ankyrin repeat protein